MTWPAQSPDLNPCDNLWSAVKREIYQGGKQYSNCNHLWVSIKASCESQADILDNRIFQVIEKKGRITKYWHYRLLVIKHYLVLIIALTQS